MPFHILSNQPFRPHAKDPFGRLLANPDPDPDILGFKNPFRIRDSVGMEGMNSRRDVAKVENLLGRAGALDLAKTDGVTGFFGARTDEAVRKFQKDRGLKVDGLIHPEGPTLKTLIAQTGEQDPPKILPTTPKPLKPMPGPDPRREAVRRAAGRKLQLQKAGIDPRAQLLQRQLAQAEPGSGEGGSGGRGGTPAPTPKPAPGAETPGKPSSPPQGSGPGIGAGKNSGADILNKLREYIDELAKNPDPRAGDIDTGGPEGQQSDTDNLQTNPSKADKQEQRDKIDSILDRFRDLLEAQLEDDAKKKIIEDLTGDKKRRKKAKQPPKQPDRPIRRSRPRGASGDFIMPPKNIRDPFEFLDFFNNLLK